MRRYFVLVSLLAMPGCSTIDRLEHTEFTPNGDGTFTYSVDIVWPYTDRERLVWLQEYLDDNGLCPNGYEVTESTTYTKSSTPLGDLKNTIIYGKCNET